MCFYRGAVKDVAAISKESQKDEINKDVRTAGKYQKIQRKGDIEFLKQIICPDSKEKCLKIILIFYVS